MPKVAKYLNKSRRIAASILLAVGCTFTWHGGANAEPIEIDRVVAVVNNAVITEFELKTRVNQVMAQLAGQKTALPPRRQLEKQVLERMISEKALMQVAEDTNIRLDGLALDRQVARMAQGSKMTPEGFRKALEAEGTDFNAFREQIRTEMTISRLKEREVDSRLVITDAEIDNFLTNASQVKDQVDEFRLAHILVLTPEGASPEKLAELKEKAEKALRELNAGADFVQVSAAYSDTQNAVQGGALGWRNEGQLPSLYSAALRDMKAGDVSPVLKSGNGFHILKLLDKRGKNVQTVIKQTHARHILVKTNEVVNDNDAKNRERRRLCRVGQVAF